MPLFDASGFVNETRTTKTLQNEKQYKCYAHILFSKVNQIVTYIHIYLIFVCIYIGSVKKFETYYYIDDNLETVGSQEKKSCPFYRFLLKLNFKMGIMEIYEIIFALNLQEAVYTLPYNSGNKTTQFKIWDFFKSKNDM